MRTAVCLKVLVCLSVLGLAGSSCWLHAQPGATPKDDRLARVFADWQKRQERIGRIRYVIRGQHIVPKGTSRDNLDRPLVPTFPPRDITQKANSVFLLDMVKQRFRMERDIETYSEKGELKPFLTTIVFDGQSKNQEIPREANAQAGNVRDDSAVDVYIAQNYARCRPLGDVASFGLTPLLLAHGVICQAGANPSFVDKLDPDDFHVHGQALHANRKCLVLRTYPLPGGTGENFSEYWVDLERDSAVVRYSLYQSGKLCEDWDIVYQPTVRGWLPLSWQYIWRDIQSRNLLGVTRLRVQEYILEPEVTDTDFQVEVKPGMLVWKDDYGAPASQRNFFGIQRKSFRIAANGEWVEVGVEGSLKPSTSSRTWLVLAAVLVAVGLGYVLWRRWKRSRPSLAPGGQV